MIDCDFAEETNKGYYCTYGKCACCKDECEIFKHGLGKEDMAQAHQAIEDIKNQRR